VASGLLLALMGAAAVWVGLADPAMASPSGWQAELSARLQHLGTVLTRALAWVPGWAVAVVLAGVVAALGRRAFREVGGSVADQARDEAPDTARGPEPTEEDTFIER